MQHQRTVLRWSLQFQSVESVFSFILFDASARQLCPRMQSWVGSTCIAKLLFRSLQEPFKTCKFSYIFLIDASSESSGESVLWHKLYWAFVARKCDNRAFHIKHWNINKRVIRTYFLKKVVTGNTQSEHLFRACTACPDTKIKILNHRPRVSNGFGYWSWLAFCWAWSGSKLIANVNSWQKSPW